MPHLNMSAVCCARLVCRMWNDAAMAIYGAEAAGDMKYAEACSAWISIAKRICEQPNMSDIPELAAIALKRRAPSVLRKCMKIPYRRSLRQPFEHLCNYIVAYDAPTSPAVRECVRIMMKNGYDPGGRMPYAALHHGDFALLEVLLMFQRIENNPSYTPYILCKKAIDLYPDQAFDIIELIRRYDECTPRISTWIPIWTYAIERQSAWSVAEK